MKTTVIMRAYVRPEYMFVFNICSLCLFFNYGFCKELKLCFAFYSSSDATTAAIRRSPRFAGKLTLSKPSPSRVTHTLSHTLSRIRARHTLLHARHIHSITHAHARARANSLSLNPHPRASHTHTLSRIRARHTHSIPHTLSRTRMRAHEQTHSL